MSLIVRCCCCSVRAGSIWTAVYTLIISLLNMGLYMYLTIIYKDMEDGYLKIPFIVYPAMVACSGVLCILSIVLLVGVIKDEHRALLPWIIVYVLYAIFEGATVFILIFFYGAYVLNIFALAWFVSRTVIGVYCLICVTSQYQELGAGRGTSFDYSRKNKMLNDEEYKERPQTAVREGQVVATDIGGQTQNQHGFFYGKGINGSTPRVSEDIELQERRAHAHHGPRMPRRPRSPKIVPREVQTPNTYSNRYFEDDVF